MIVHSGEKEDGSTEMNERTRSSPTSSDAETNGEMLFRAVKAKERQLAHQKAILKDGQEELASLKALLDYEEDPEERAVLLEIVKNFALATQGKKEQFVAMYGEWKTALLKVDIDLQHQGQEQRERQQQQVQE